jgi:hypothetical protein
MNPRKDPDLALSSIAVQAIPDGSDNINGLLTALLGSISAEEARADQCAGVRGRRVRNRGSWIRGAWFFWRQRMERAVFLNAAQFPEK